MRRKDEAGQANAALKAFAVFARERMLNEEAELLPIL
jgi:hypothetical protein